MKKNLFLASLLLGATTTFGQTVKQVGAGGDYATLSSAAFAVNSGVLTGNIEFQIISNITETSVININRSGVGSANYSTIKIYPTASNVSISNNLTSGGLFTFDGARNVTIDGRLNGTGAPYNLTIKAAMEGNANMIHFKQRARYNVIENCKIEHASPWHGSAVTMESAGMDTATHVSHNILSDNIFEYTDIATSTIGGISMIHLGSYAHSNQISNNQFKNIFYKAASTSSHAATIVVNDYTYGNQIVDNHFYNTASISPNGTNMVRYATIHIKGNNDNYPTNKNYVGGNYIGGTDVNAGGTPMILGNAVEFVGILLEGSNYNNHYYTIENNTIANIELYANKTLDYNFIGIYHKTGKVNIWNNTIGSATTANSIVINDVIFAATQGYGILAENAYSNIEQNVIANIKASSISTGAATPCSFTAIGKIKPRFVSPVGLTGYIQINNNTIGSPSMANAIEVVGHANNAPNFAGIHIAAADSFQITNNEIGNLYYNNENATATTTTGVFGILLSDSSSVGPIDNNHIHHIRSKSQVNNLYVVSGILLRNIDHKGRHLITNNEIHHLESLYTGTNNTSVQGIGISVPTTATTSSHIIANNFIHSLKVNATALTGSTFAIAGVRTFGGKSITVYNNVINLNEPKGIAYGLYNAIDADNFIDAYNNTIVISAVFPVNGTSYGVYNARTLINNIIYNDRTYSYGTTMKNHFGVLFNHNTSVLAKPNNKYNMYYVPNTSTGAAMVRYRTVNYSDIATYLSAGLTVDSFSQFTNPNFANVAGDVKEDYIADSTFVGFPVSLYVNDIVGNTRSSYSVGAFEKMTALSMENITLQLSINQGNLVQIDWNVLNPQDIQSFEIQSSKDAINWKTIQTQKASFATAYSTIDPKVLVGKNYYRVKVINKNASQYFSTVSWIENAQNQLVKAFPNPAQSVFQLDLGSNRTAAISIFDIKGNTVMQMPNYNNLQMIDMSQLAIGVYMVKVQMDQHTEMINIVKH